MSQMRRSRPGVTLVELLVVIAIMAVLIGLLIPAVTMVRRSAAQTDGMNRLKQIALALQHFASTHEGRLPNVDGGGPTKSAVMAAIQPYLSHGAGRPEGPHKIAVIPYYKNPADPSAWGPRRESGNCSYGANAVAFVNDSKLDSVTDGLAATVAFTERYARCGRTDVNWSVQVVECHPSPCVHPPRRRATFADELFLDHRPGSPTPAVTFQANPLPAECDDQMPQSTGPGGLAVALFDGSVRTVSPRVSPPTFWAAVTPSAGDELGRDW